ncbi:uncharacterized protein TNCT_193841 [Trichonephila clavata]|uniref:Uncharacterized protein n=1 Tax=Trichonephila clavata TaxID=2740835 RepID=A0A8X6KE28_TRICU|nr:uncharacterized protein TNCT_193841 [Trichonephila clavata]
MSEDIFPRAHRENPNLDVQYSENIFIESLISLEDMCEYVNIKKHLYQLGLFSPEYNGVNVIDRDILRQKQYDINELKIYVEAQIRILTHDPRLAYDSVMKHVQSGTIGTFFLDTPGGAVNTFLLNLINKGNLNQR